MMTKQANFLVPLLVLMFQLQSFLCLLTWAASVTVSPTGSSSSSIPNQRDLNHMLDNNYAETSNNFGQLNSNNIRSRSQQVLIQASPIEISENDSTNGAIGNYQNQNPRLRVNISNVCEKNHMKITVRFSRPFNGLIHAKEKRKKAPCFVEGNGDQFYTLDISFTLLPNDAAYCGMVSHPMNPNSALPTTTSRQYQTNQMAAMTMNQSVHQGSQETLSLALVVRLHKTIEFSDDRYFLLSCPNRCSRSDCSYNPVEHSVSTDDRKGFLVSDSILSPVFGSPGQPKHSLNQQLTVATNERSCDMMIDLKFQWLVKLCWILIGLIALMFCTIFYLCIASSSGSSNLRNRQYDRKISGKDNHRRGNKHQSVASRKSSTTATTTTTAAAPFQSQSSDQSSTYQPKSSSEATESPTTTELGWSMDQPQQQMDKLRENNHYLANRQHLLINDFLAAKNAIEEYEQQQQQSRPVLGRSEVQTFAGRQSGHILRRRSIGGSAAMLNCLQDTETPPANYHQRSDQIGGSRLDPKHKLKSKSQTTIYYEQAQDPFKTMPFNVSGYLGGYPSNDQSHHQPDDGHISGQPRNYSFVDLQPPAVSNGASFIHNPQVDTHWSDFESQSLPANKFQGPSLFVANRSNELRANSLHQQQHSQLWRAAQNSADETTMSSNNIQARQDLQSRIATSQFDPQNHSQQLIDLIQQKHREQTARANKTAAGMKTHNNSSACDSIRQPPTKPLPKPILTSQQQRQSNIVDRTEQQQQWR